MKNRITDKLFSIIVSMLLLLGGCSEPAQPEGKTFYHSIYSFGTLIDVSIYGVDEKAAELAFDQLEADFNYMHVTWQPWQRSALARNNLLLASREWFSDAPSVRPLILLGKKFTTLSDGLFNPAIGKLIKLWGFNKGEHETGIPPDDADIQKLVKAHPSMNDIEIDGIRMRSRNADVFLDVGGFGKGYGIQRTIDSLRAMGIENAIINAGGDLQAIGSHGKRPWRVAIRHPRQEKTVLAYIDLKNNESVFTSGDYERFYIYKGKRYHHILDPRTGYPATEAQSVTVIHTDPALADAASTALFVAGAKDWARIAKKMGITYVLLIDASGKMHMTAQMQKRLDFKNTPTDTTITTLQ